MGKLLPLSCMEFSFYFGPQKQPQLFWRGESWIVAGKNRNWQENPVRLIQILRSMAGMSSWPELQMDAEAIVASRRGSNDKETPGANSSDSRNTHPTSKHVVVLWVSLVTLLLERTLLYIVGKISHFEMPPGTFDEDLADSSFDENISNDSGSEDQYLSHTVAGGPLGEASLQQALDDLESFDLSGNVLAKTAAKAKKINTLASYKHHRKPQRKKDRSWRVGNDGGDGMPVVRVFQKPAVSFEAIKASN